MGLSNDNIDLLYQTNYNKANLLTDWLISNSKTQSYKDIKYTFLSLGKSLLKTNNTLYKIANDQTDIVSCYSLIRIQADMMATMYLVFGASNKDELEFRYWLYILDGTKERVKVLTETKDIVNSPQTTKDKVQTFIKNLEKIITLCNESLCRHKYKEQYPVAYANIVNSSNWRYKSLEPTNEKNKYNWKEMYGLFEKRETMQKYYSHCSQYIHSLSSQLLTDDQAIHFKLAKHSSLVMVMHYMNLVKLIDEYNLI